MRLFHISEEPDIARFVPRPAPSQKRTLDGAFVWAIAETTVWTYLTPRDCPRITFYANAKTMSHDVDAYLCGERAGRAAVIETAWFERCLATTLYRYEFNLSHFSLHDPGIQYYLSQRVEEPIDVTTIANPLLELAQMGVELRVMPSLWELRERIFRSSLVWSFIRMRNATPPSRGYDAYLPVN